MRISTKGRYALAAVVSMAQQHSRKDNITAVSISDKLGISKIYLEQVLALLKRGGLVSSVKGAQGGYLLSRTPEQINVYDVLAAVEVSLFEKTEDTVPKTASDIEAAMRLMVFEKLDCAVNGSLKKITLDDLVSEAERHQEGKAQMFYI